MASSRRRGLNSPLFTVKGADMATKTEQGHEQTQDKSDPRADKPEVDSGNPEARGAQSATGAPRGPDFDDEVSPDVRSGAERFGTGMVGGVSHIATDLVRGVGDVGEEVVITVRDTANTAIAGVGSIGQTAIHTLADLVAGVVDGVREIGSSARSRGMTSTEQRFESKPETRQESRMH
jgi:hypothetical protein